MPACMMTPPRSPLAALLGAVFLSAACLRGQPAPAPEPPAAPLTLDEALALALAASPSLAAARLSREEARARQDVARQRPNPELALEEQKEFPRDAAPGSPPIETAGERDRRGGGR